MNDDIVARLRRHAKVPFEKIERKSAFDAAKRIVKDRNSDILERLRAIVTVSGGVTNSKADHVIQAADEIERLRGQIEHHARDRIEYCAAWSKWIEENDGLEIAQWCRAYADAMPYPNPDGPEIVRVIHSRLDARHRKAADEIERLRARVAELENMLEDSK